MGRRLTPEERAFRKVTERQLQDRLIEVGEMYGWRVSHFSDSRRQVRPGVFVGDKQAKGFPDLVLVRPPELLVWELKKEVGAPVTPEQQEWLDDLAASGVEVAVVRPSNEEAARKRLMRSRR